MEVIGSNMRRLRESSVAETVQTCVVAGPGDLLVWEVRVSVNLDGFPLEVSGRGTDLESAAAAAMPLLSHHAGGVFQSPESPARGTGRPRGVEPSAQALHDTP